MARRLPLLAIALLACGGGSQPTAPDASPAADAAPVPDDIEAFLATVPGLRFERGQTEYPGYTSYRLWFEQRLDQGGPDPRTFEQRMILHHIGRDAPMVLYTSGYYLFSEDYVSELGVAMGANQLSTEQRFFGESRPDALDAEDWQFLTIWQAAADHHRIALALAPYYTGRWLSTGHSKGGMTSIYHRRFYPDDVDATVAYVAPISFGAPDTRYEPFFDTVGDASCRDALAAAQVEALGSRYAAMLRRAEADAAAAGMTFTRTGGQAAAFESDIAAMHWGFWQYFGDAYCGAIPATTADDDTLYAFLAEYGGIGTDDASVAAFEPYYYQASAELGWPSVPTAFVADLLDYADAESSVLPPGVVPVYDAAAMADVDAWVRSTDAALMFVYGENDPWSGGMFELGDATDAYRFVAPGANHGANLRALDATDRDRAVAVIEGWMATDVTLPSFFAAPPPPLPRVPPVHLLRR